MRHTSHVPFACFASFIRRQSRKNILPEELQMKFTVNKIDFEKAIVPVSIVAQSKTAESSLNGIYLRAENKELTLYCYDIEKGIKTSIDADITD